METKKETEKPLRSQKTLRLIGAVVGAFCLCLVAISSLHYKSLVLQPVQVWHGANLGVRSLLSNSTDSDHHYSNANFKHLREHISAGGFQQKPFPDDVNDHQSSHLDIRNKIATNQAQRAQFKQDVARMKEAQQQHLNSKKALDGVNQSLYGFAAYQQTELAKRQAINEAIEDESNVPTKEEIDQLIASHRTPSSQASNNKIPEQVLINVQQTTGISPDKINELMNK